MKIAREWIVGCIRNRVIRINGYFNQLSKRNKQVATMTFVCFGTAISVMLVIQAAENEKGKVHFSPDHIAIPHDIFMGDESGISEDQLTPVGKMKGEIDGEFESFYVAVDGKGCIFINRDIEYSERAYDKTDDWKQISKEKLMEYEKELHFIPSWSKGLRK